MMHMLQEIMGSETHETVYVWLENNLRKLTDEQLNDLRSAVNERLQSKEFRRTPMGPRRTKGAADSAQERMRQRFNATDVRKFVQ